jgi:hypothetical protein
MDSSLIVKLSLYHQLNDFSFEFMDELVQRQPMWIGLKAPYVHHLGQNRMSE